MGNIWCWWDVGSGVQNNENVRHSCSHKAERKPNLKFLHRAGIMRAMQTSIGRSCFTAC